MLGELASAVSEMAGGAPRDDVYKVYATHQLAGQRVNSAPGIVTAPSYDAAVDWVLEDSRVVDYYVKHIPAAEYQQMRRDAAASRIIETTLVLRALREGLQLTE